MSTDRKQTGPGSWQAPLATIPMSHEGMDDPDPGWNAGSTATTAHLVSHHTVKCLPVFT